MTFFPQGWENKNPLCFPLFLLLSFSILLLLLLFELTIPSHSSRLPQASILLWKENCLVQKVLFFLKICIPCVHPTPTLRGGLSLSLSHLDWCGHHAFLIMTTERKVVFAPSVGGNGQPISIMFAIHAQIGGVIPMFLGQKLNTR